jgi:hypothetical protein
LTVETGILYFVASLTNVPSDFSCATLADGSVGLPEVDPELIAGREREADRNLSRMLLRLIRKRGVLRQHGVGSPEQHLRHRIGVARIALQREADLRFESFEVFLVLRPGLYGNGLSLQLVRAVDPFWVARLHDQHAVRPHVGDDARLLLAIGCDEDAADHRVAAFRVQGRDQARERRLRRRCRIAPRPGELHRHVDVEADDLAAAEHVLHRRERRVGAVLERRRLAGGRSRSEYQSDRAQRDDELAHGPSSSSPEGGA